MGRYASSAARFAWLLKSTTCCPAIQTAYSAPLSKRTGPGRTGRRRRLPRRQTPLRSSRTTAVHSAASDASQALFCEQKLLALQRFQKGFRVGDGRRAGAALADQRPRGSTLELRNVGQHL